MQHLLIVEDSRELLNLFTRTFERRGYKVTSATDGLQALELLKTITPGYMILDLNIPRVRGLDVLTFVRYTQRLQLMKIVIITGAEPTDDNHDVYELADLFLMKPVSISDLVALIERL